MLAFVLCESFALEVTEAKVNKTGLPIHNPTHVSLSSEHISTLHVTLLLESQNMPIFDVLRRNVIMLVSDYLAGFGFTRTDLSVLSCWG